MIVSFGLRHESYIPLNSPISAEGSMSLKTMNSFCRLLLVMKHGKDAKRKYQDNVRQRIHRFGYYIAGDEAWIQCYEERQF
jgi:hypothetical protein